LGPGETEIKPRVDMNTNMNLNMNNIFSWQQAAYYNINPNPDGPDEKFENSCIPQKISGEYILLSTFGDF
jgi:hypothetical protein